MVDLWIMAPMSSRLDWLANCVSVDPQIRVAGTATSFAFLRSQIAEKPADIFLIELSGEIHTTTSRDWLLEFLELGPVVLLSPDPNPAVFNRLRRDGPGGLLQLSASPEQILQAIRSVVAGLAVFDNSLAMQSPDDESPLEELTPREAEVLQLLAEGLGNKEIALRLNISEHTIKFHIRSILGKLGAASRTDAVARGLRGGLIEL
jgi:two-component system, NarL family, response regulator YdfI